MFNEDPQILNDDIAFKPIAFDAPVFNESEDIKEEPIVQIEEPKPVLESMTPIHEPEPVFTPQPIVEEEVVEEKPVIETIKPVEPVIQESETVVEPVRPITPVVNNFQAPIENKEHSKPGFIYYVLLLVLILLSVFTLWLYQKNISGDTTPVLTAKATETVVAEPKVVEKVEQPAPVVVNEQQNDDVFLNEEPAVAEPVSVETKEQEPIEEEQDEEPIEEPTPMVDTAPVVMDVVPSRLNTSVDTDAEEENVISEEDILANKPVYEPGAKYDDMFVSEEDYESGFISPDSESDYLYDAEEAAYQEEMGY